MKKLPFLLLLLMFVCCDSDMKDKPLEVFPEIEAASDNPCVQCTDRLMKVLQKCLAEAGSDEAKKSACNKKASEDWVRECQAICKPTLAEETPRMKCLKEAQLAHLKCRATAKTPAEKAACDKALADAIALCPPPVPNE